MKMKKKHIQQMERRNRKNESKDDIHVRIHAFSYVSQNKPTNTNHLKEISKIPYNTFKHPHSHANINTQKSSHTCRISTMKAF